MHAAEKLRCHVLIAEDSSRDLETLLAALDQTSEMEFIPTIVNGTDLLNYLMGRGEYANRENYPYPKLLIADLKMHLAKGMEFMRWVYEHPDSGMTIIMVDDGRSGTDEESARRLGVDTFLTKPLRARDIRQIGATLEQLVLHSSKPGACGIGQLRLDGGRLR